MIKMGSFFELGQTVQTMGIATEIENNARFAKEVINAFVRYTNCDWGDLNAEDKEMNNSAIKNNDDRILAKYNTNIAPIYIITEWDRSYTTIMFCDEY